MWGTNKSGFGSEKRHRHLHSSPLHDEQVKGSPVLRTDGALLALARLLAEIAVGTESRPGQAVSAEPSTTSDGGLK